MKNLWTMREKHEEIKRNCLLKKIKFYQYLISYAGPQQFLSNQDHSKNKTTTIFFPTIDSEKEMEDPHRSETKGSEAHRVDTDALDSGQPKSTLREPKIQKLRMRQTFRLGKKEEVSSIEELTAKSMTPSVRINKSKTNHKHRNEIALIESSFTPRRHLSLERGPIPTPSKPIRTGMGVVGRQRNRPPRLSIQRPRKHSICPWQFQSSPL